MHRTFTARPNVSGQLQLQFSDAAAGDPYWVVNAIAVRTAASVGPLTVTRSGRVVAGGRHDAAGHVHGDRRPSGSLYTVSTTLGTVAGVTDAESAYAGIQVLADGRAAGVHAGQSGRAGGGDGDGHGGDGRGARPVPADVRDGAGAAVRLQRAEQLHGVGLHGRAGQRRRTRRRGLRLERGGAASSSGRGPSPLRRDGAYGAGSGGATFTVQADPAKQYNVRVYVGDTYAVRDQIQVTVEGATPYTIASLAAGTFDTRTTRRARRRPATGC